MLDYFDHFELLPDNPTAEEAQELATPAGMRARLERYALHCPWVARAFDLGRMRGTTGHDLMTVLAFYALAENQRLRRRLIEQTKLENRVYYRLPSTNHNP